MTRAAGCVGLLMVEKLTETLLGFFVEDQTIIFRKLTSERPGDY